MYIYSELMQQLHFTEYEIAQTYYQYKVCLSHLSYMQTTAPISLDRTQHLHQPNVCSSAQVNERERKQLWGQV